jgi:adenylyltransferase/sulfurtransferase
MNHSNSKVIPGIKPIELHAALSSKKVALLDVREPEELEHSVLPNAVHIPLMSLAGELARWELAVKDCELAVVYCRSGVRSEMAIQLLEESGVAGCLNLTGGINAYAKEVDCGLSTY